MWEMDEPLQGSFHDLELGRDGLVYAVNIRINQLAILNPKTGEQTFRKYPRGTGGAHEHGFVGHEDPTLGPEPPPPYEPPPVVVPAERVAELTRQFSLRGGGPVSEAQLARAQGWFQRYGVWTLLMSWLPVVGDALTVVAGSRERPRRMKGSPGPRRVFTGSIAASFWPVAR